MRIFKTRWFVRYARQERIADASLREAIARAERGLVDADLGGGVIKRRLARPGRGRSGGYRTFIAIRRGDRAIFVFAFAKNDRDNIGGAELEALKDQAEDWARNEHRRARCSHRRGSAPGGRVMKKRSRLTEALLETAGDMLRSGIISKERHDKITKPLLGRVTPPKPLSGTQIRALREKAKMSQSVFAHHLNVTPGYVSQLERGAKHPTGAALALLNVIKRKGIEVIL